MIRRGATLLALLAVLLALGGLGEFLHDILHHGTDCSPPGKCQVCYLLFVAAAAVVGVLLVLPWYTDLLSAVIPTASNLIRGLFHIPAIVPRAPPAT